MSSPSEKLCVKSNDWVQFSTIIKNSLASYICYLFMRRYFPSSDKLSIKNGKISANICYTILKTCLDYRVVIYKIWRNVIFFSMILVENYIKLKYVKILTSTREFHLNRGIKRKRDEGSSMESSGESCMVPSDTGSISNFMDHSIIPYICYLFMEKFSPSTINKLKESVADLYTLKKRLVHIYSSSNDKIAMDEIRNDVIQFTKVILEKYPPPENTL